MSTQVPTRFQDDELALLDQLIADGIGESRSHTIRIAVADLSDRHRRAQLGEAIAASFRSNPQSADDDAWAMANANAMTAAEPW